VWGWQVMPWWQTVPLKLLAHTLPGMTLTGEGLDIKPSDNKDMLLALGKDPLIIKKTRVDAIYGLTDLMEAALVNSAKLNMKALILYGEHDEIIPPEAFCKMLVNLPDQMASDWRLVLYQNGYHMLSRDLQGEVVIQDMITWIHNQNAAFPSAQEIVQHDVRLSVFSQCSVQ
jgi:alpha-beta hydrolase superfamily lysophospholipase